MLDWNTNYMAWILIWHLMNSALCSQCYWPENKTFWIHPDSLLYLIHSQWDWSCLKGTSSLSEALTQKERWRWQEKAPPAFRFAHLSTLCSHAGWALPFSAAQCSPGHLLRPLNSILPISKYTKMFPALDGEAHGNFRFSFKLITKKCFRADEVLQIGSATAFPAPGLPRV